jgi:hypothetical protein
MKRKERMMARKKKGSSIEGRERVHTQDALPQKGKKE